MISLTAYLALKKMENRDPDYPDWGTVENENMDVLDLAFGSFVYTEDNYIASSVTPVPPNAIVIVESHSGSLDVLDMQLKDTSDLMPTQDQRDALIGEGTPAGANKYVTKSYVRPARKKVLFPEGEGTVLTPSPGGANTGNMTSTGEAHSNYIYNHYKWLSAEGAFQNYDISIQWRVPDTFLNFRSGVNLALIVDISTEENTTTNNKVEVILKKDGVAGTSTSGEVCSAVATDWYSERQSNGLIAFDDSDIVLSTLVAGNILDITIRLSSRGNKYAKVGAVTIQYSG